MARRLKVLMSAYSCEPGRGSEPGIGWAIVSEMARYHDIWVITRADQRLAIEAELAQNPRPGLHFLYRELPRWTRFSERGVGGEHLDYYLWQLRILGIARVLHAEVKFDLVHHVTFGRYSTPSFLCFLGVPFVWGPVGGGESAPRSFWLSGGWRSILFETSRAIARWVGEHAPFVRATARRSAVALAATPESAARLRALGSRCVETLLQNGLLDDELERIQKTRAEPKTVIRFVSIGRVVHWKGCDISLRAFAQANIASAEFWLIGDGPDRRRLKALSATLGIADRVQFCGTLPRDEVFSRLDDCDVLLHPSLHDSGGTATIEAMAAGLPVICLDLGGPAMQVTANSGIKIAARNPEQAIHDIAAAMIELARDEELRRRLSQGAREHVRHEFRWSLRGARFNTIYQQVSADNDAEATRRPAMPSTLLGTRDI
jgi:glycosyltransferase involved in cell wall biosynthesis